MSRSRIEARLGGVVDLGRARCLGRAHRFSKLGRDGTGKGNVEPAADGLVWGVVYELELVQFERLVAFESGYRVVELGLDGGVAWGFEAVVPAGRQLAPTREYLEHYVAGVREHAIPDEYLNAVLGEFAGLLAG